jgi:hypothetical protein
VIVLPFREKEAVMEMQTVERPTTRLKQGSLDHAAAVMQMRAIDYALCVYFGADDWVGARDRQIPSMRRTWAMEHPQSTPKVFQ